MAHIFANSKNIFINGTNTFNAIQNLSANRIDEGLRILYNHAVPGALHDSGERFDPPNCHEATRIAIREEIMNWIDDAESEFPVMWMNGPMGGGKSSIAQALAELYHRRRQMSGSFFFARASPTRNNEKRLVATLAYQMSKEMPQTRPHISAAILHDPLIFYSSLKTQIEALIIGPHFHADDSGDGSAPRKPRLIIIDGLDECVNIEAQAVIVKAFISSVVAYRDKLPISLKILIVSRPEVNIDTAFRDPNLSTSVKWLSLNERWGPDHDIRRYLLDSFEEIRRSHPVGRSLLDNWPPITDVDELVRRSSGQFIYASVVVTFLQSPQNHPIHSLQVILGLTKDVNSRPYAVLDALYEYIFSQVKDLHLVLRILCLRLTKNHHKIAINLTKPGSTISMIKDILELSEGMFTVSLTNLVSVLKYDPDIDRDDMIFYHASLSEFLQDEDRSGRLHVNSEEICADIAGRCVPFNKNPELEGSLRLRLLVFQLMYDFLSPQMRSSLCDAFSSMNIMSSLEDMCQSLNFCEDGMDLAIDYIHWFFDKHANNSITSLPDSLENSVKLCSEYILQHFKAFPFNGFDRADRVDVWVFAMSGISTSTGMFRMRRTVEVMSSLTNTNHSKFTKFEKSPSTRFCWEILHYIPLNILTNTELFGEYAMTGDRSTYAAVCLFKEIVKINLLSINDHLRHYPIDIGDSLQDISDLFCQTPASKDLYKALQETMIEHTSKKFSEKDSPQELAYQYVMSTFDSSVRHGGDCLKEFASVFSDYMERTHREIPNIDSIIQEERKAASRSKILARPRQFFKGKKNKLITRLKGGDVTLNMN